MHCPKCNEEQEDTALECRFCGIIFEKYHQALDRQRRESGKADKMTDVKDEDSLPKKIGQLLFHTAPKVSLISFAGRAIIFIIIVIWGIKFMAAPIKSNYAGQSFMHLVNLPFHEAGHIVFRPFGDFITSLGGTLGQLLMPLICLGVLLIQTRDTFGAAIALWWFGQNFIDIAPYINDARSLTLPLLGGNFGDSTPYGFHDWEYILTETGLLSYDHFLAKASVLFGAFFMTTACTWAAFLLYKQYKNLKNLEQTAR